MTTAALGRYASNQHGPDGTGGGICWEDTNREGLLDQNLRDVRMAVHCWAQNGFGITKDMVGDIENEVLVRVVVAGLGYHNWDTCQT